MDMRPIGGTSNHQSAATLLVFKALRSILRCLWRPRSAWGMTVDPVNVSK